MLFNSLAFAVFIAVFFPVYLALRRHHSSQNIWILLASYVFYGWWDWRFLLLISFTIVLDHYVAQAIALSDSARRRKQFLILSIASNLSILALFKYLNFFIDSAILFANEFGLQIDPLTLAIVLPVGISFYTFQSMSYVIDVYRREIEPTPSLSNYATYVSFFPQLVAGPIERATRLLPQILNPRDVTIANFYEGCHLIFWGLFKKIFIADNLARTVNPVFASPNPSAEQIVVAVYAFAFQIYCDFSAYSDIARGIAKMLGIDLMVNFRLPYFASNPAEFWRRWHISLSTWLRDYLYIPLGGTHAGLARTCRNLMITMILGGIWHGAAANFFFWGIYHGTLLTTHRVFRNFIPTSSNSKNVCRFQEIRLRCINASCVLVFFQFTCYGWLLFRAESGDQVIGMTRALLGGIDITELPTMFAKPAVYILPLLAVQTLQWYRKDLLAMYRLPVPVRTAIYVSMFYAILCLGATESSEFIYFQF